MRFLTTAALVAIAAATAALAEHGDLIRKYNVAYFMASVDPIEKNTRVRQGDQRQPRTERGREEASRLPILSDPTRTTATAYGVLAAPMTGVARRWTRIRNR